MNTQISSFEFTISQSESLCKDENGRILAVSFPFIKNGKFLDKNAPSCCLSLKPAGSMRFKWNEQNDVRQKFFTKINVDYDLVLSPELSHSKTIFCVDNNEESALFKALCSTGDAVLTSNKEFVPAVTVADCVPIYLYHIDKNVFGVVHSGWKGTGIVKEAVERAVKTYGAEPTGFCAVIGPHIKSCCYTVDSERADYFRKNFGSECIKREELDKEFGFHLSLGNANLKLLLEAGVPAENIATARECTCCTEFLGSNRRETAGLADSVPLEERLKEFTAMAAFVKW